ncbi:DUF2797 domain-containing protein [Kitasatospora sp. McL0602]|uniref:DUF2797 domain-containing protein n=1 Tax=Kitasatospora sp. McL0602 TaxID=3439530 RepID=UPI003F8B5D7F
METKAQGWTATGLRWQGGRPSLTAVSGLRAHERIVTPGTEVGWRVLGPRRCTGARTAAGQRPCPHRAVIEAAAKSVQCEPCQGADVGLALARDQILDNGQTYRLYLAWFGTGLLKIGITAEQRGTTRLEEQAALAFTFVGRGRLPAVRRAELTVAQAGLARERLTTRAKTAGWWALPDGGGRLDRLAELRGQVLRLLDGHALELLPDGPLVDQCGLFGLADGAPPAYREITALSADATLGGVLRAPVGRYLFIDTADDPERPLLLDTRLLTGWALAGAAPGPLSGLTIRPCRRPAEPGAQDSLF